ERAAVGYLQAMDEDALDRCSCPTAALALPRSLFESPAAALRRNPTSMESPKNLAPADLRARYTVAEDSGRSPPWSQPSGMRGMSSKTTRLKGLNVADRLFTDCPAPG